jgi:hypothetical protein
MDQINKTALDDVLLGPNGREKLQKLLANAEPTIKLQLEEETPTELLIKEISRIQSECEKDKWVKLISEKREISQSAINKDLKKYEPREDHESLEKKYTAYFPELVDLVEDEAGNVAFLVKEGEKLVIKPSVVVDSETFYAPVHRQLPFKFLPRGVEVLKHFSQDADQKLFADLITYLKLVSELPNDDLYELIAAWILHTYLLEAFEYSPYIWLYAIPERGKSRTGKGAIYVAYRGVHVESLRDPYLIRISNNLKATIFFDAMDIWGKAEKAGSEDFLLQRYEHGALVARVLYPERGAYEDTKYFDIWGATLVATNEPVHQALESRAVLISMKEASREFGDIPLELARSLKERLVALRARHLGRELPQIDKPAKGRLGDILKPLMQVILLVAPEWEKEFRQLISQLDQDRKVQKSESTDAKLISIIAGLEREVEEGLLRSQKILEAYNQGVSEKFKISDKSLGWKLKALGFPKKQTENGKCIVYDKKLLESLMVKFGLKDEDCSKAPSDKDKSSISDNVSPDVSQGSEETSAKRQPENADKHWSADNPDVPDFFPSGVKKENNSPNFNVHSDSSKNTQSNYEIIKIIYATGEDVYQVVKAREDGKPTYHIITPDCPEFEDVRREYEQQTR